MTIEVGEVAMVPLESIEVGDRAREEMGDLNSVEKSIKEDGLISPLAVKRIDNGSYFLLAGERRYVILSRNKVERVPVRIYPDDLSDLQMKSIEMAENFYRKDFEYWESDNLFREMHELQQTIHGVKARGPGNEGWGLKDTAEMAGVTDASVSTAIKRSEAREAFPELFETCKTQKDASKLIQKLNEEVTKDQIARKLEAAKTEGKLNQLAKCFILKGFFEGVKEIPDSIMHLVEIDPPYAIDLKKAKKSDSAISGTAGLDTYNEIDKEVYIEGHPDPNHPWRGIRQLFQECYRVMTQHSWLLCWFAPEPWFEIVYQELNNAGFETTRMCGIWTKGYGQTKRPEIHLANTYEMFFYAWKGRPALNKAGRGNQFDISPIPAGQKTHPTERPIPLMKEIYDTFAFTGSRVLIPFLGSGNGLIAADQLAMSPVGFELSKQYRDSFLVKVHNME
jgi:DNA modification methylase